MTRAYIRLDPDYFEKRLDRGDPPGAVGAYIATLCLAESQPKRGRFRDESVLRALLTPKFARWVPFMFEHGDLVMDGRRVYVEGWDEWQEGDWKVAERVALVRKRKGVTGTVTPTVTGGDTKTVSIRKKAVEAEAEAVSGGGGGKRRLVRNAGPVPLTEILHP